MMSRDVCRWSTESWSERQSTCDTAISATSSTSSVSQHICQSTHSSMSVMWNFWTVWFFLNRVQTDFQFFTHPYFTVDIELRVMYITRTIPLALSAVLHYTTPFTSHNDSTVSHEPLFTCKCLRFHWVSSCCVC